jgi:hypothetical protein
MDNFTRHYIIAALWSSVDDDGEPLDARFSADDLAPETVAKMSADCARFQAENAALLAEVAPMHVYHPDAETPDASAGHDFWLTRNRHGAGLWDRGYGDTGKQLTDAAHTFGECDLYIGDDGKIYC